MPHVVLLGDSIFDNAAYVAGGPDVVNQLREILPPGWKATLLAVDGSITSDVPRQIARLPSDATHLVLSAGGNDALGEVDILERRTTSMAEALDLLAELRARFERRYLDMLQPVVATGLPLTVCTIYEGAFPDPEMQRRASTALHMFNDVIVRAATTTDLDVLDLRMICSEPTDYANPIEPSVQGGDKISRGILHALTSDRVHGARILAGAREE